MRRFGRAYLISLVRAYRLNNPSNLETLVQKAIVKTAPDLNIEWEREYQWTGESEFHWLVDFLLYYDGEEIAVEVNGKFFHSKPDRMRKDEMKAIDARLRFDRYIVIEEDEINANKDDLAGYIRQLITTHETKED